MAAPLAPGALVWFLAPEHRHHRYGHVQAVDGDLVLVAHGTERHPKTETWHNRAQLATPAEWTQIQREQRRHRDRGRGRR